MRARWLWGHEGAQEKIMHTQVLDAFADYLTPLKLPESGPPNSSGWP